MIEARRLRIERQRIIEPGTSDALQQLLSGQVLVEWQPSSEAPPQRQQLAFSHNILFDFAVSQLFLPWESTDFARVVAHDPDLILMIRPSIVMRFQQLWDTDRAAFWSLLFGLCSDAQIPPVGKVIGAAVLAQSARVLPDFDPLVKALADEGLERATAETAFRHLVGGLTAGPVSAYAGNDAGPYCELLRVVTQAPNEFVAGYAATLLREILNQRSLTHDQLQAAGKAAAATDSCTSVMSHLPWSEHFLMWALSKATAGFRPQSFAKCLRLWVSLLGSVQSMLAYRPLEVRKDSGEQAAI